MSLPITLSVGGTRFVTAVATLEREPNSVLAQLSDRTSPPDGHFVDEDAETFRLVLASLRSGALPPDLSQRERQEMASAAQRLGLRGLQELLGRADRPSGSITVGYRGTFAFGRDGQADVKFRKLSRILVCGKVELCREVFGETLNESRDPDCGGEAGRYTARLFLKHSLLEQAFDALFAQGFQMTGCGASGASSYNPASATPTGDKGGPRSSDSEELRWYHYNEFVFYRPP